MVGNQGRLRPARYLIRQDRLLRAHTNHVPWPYLMPLQDDLERRRDTLSIDIPDLGFSAAENALRLDPHANDGTAD